MMIKRLQIYLNYNHGKVIIMNYLMGFCTLPHQGKKGLGSDLTNIPNRNIKCFFYSNILLYFITLLSPNSNEKIIGAYINSE